MVAQHLREQIIEGRMSPGSPVRQEAVAKDLGVSRIPVREALALLEREGLVTIRPHSGARVAVLDFDECMELYKIRERVEPLALSESIGLLTEEDLSRVRELAAHAESVADDYVAWIEADRRFHVACVASNHLPHLTRLVEGFWNTTQQYRRILVRQFTPEDFDLYQCEHRLIVEALRTQNHRGAEDVMRLHIERARLRIAALREEFDR
jgi:DNA-binding GntR family transcriptional regulator